MGVDKPGRKPHTGVVVQEARAMQLPHKGINAGHAGGSGQHVVGNLNAGSVS